MFNLLFQGAIFIHFHFKFWEGLSRFLGTTKFQGDDPEWTVRVEGVKVWYGYPSKMIVNYCSIISPASLSYINYMDIEYYIEHMMYIYIFHIYT